MRSSNRLSTRESFSADDTTPAEVQDLINIEALTLMFREKALRGVRSGRSLSLYHLRTFI